MPTDPALRERLETLAQEHDDEAARIEREAADLPRRVKRDADCERESAATIRAAIAALDTKDAEIARLEFRHRFLREFALNRVRWNGNGYDGEIQGLAEPFKTGEWTPWQETKATGGQWFWFTDQAETEFHIDQVEPGGTGFIETKHGCGLDYYPLCQPATLSPDVLEALAEHEAREARRWSEPATAEVKEP